MSAWFYILRLKSVGQWFNDMGKKTGEAFKQEGKKIRNFFSSD